MLNYNNSNVIFTLQVFMKHELLSSYDLKKLLTYLTDPILSMIICIKKKKRIFYT